MYRGYPIEQLAEHGDFLETCYLLLYGELPTAAQKADFDYRVTRHTMVHEQMSRFFQGFRRDAHPMAIMTGSIGALVGVLSRLHRHRRSVSAHGRLAAHDRQSADARRHGLQIFRRPAVHLSEERARLFDQFPAHVLRGAGGRVQAQPGAGARHGPHLHPACRPRAERLDLDGAACRLLGRQSVRLHRRRLRLPVGARAWRRQRSRAQHAARNRDRRAHSGIHQARQGQERSLPADGLRPPRLQELRPARQDHAEDLPRGLDRTRHQGRSAARCRHGAGKDRAARRLFRREEALSEHRLLFGHHAQGDGLPHHHVHRAVCGGAHGRLDRAVEGNDRGPEAEDRPPAPALYRRAPSAITCRFRGGNNFSENFGRRGGWFSRPFRLSARPCR